MPSTATRHEQDERDRLAQADLDARPELAAALVQSVHSPVIYRTERRPRRSQA